MSRECSCPLCGSPIGEVPVTILPERGMVVANGQFVVMPASEMLLLQRLVEVFPRVLSKERAMDCLYQLRPDGGAEPTIINCFICKLRKKLEPLGIRIDTTRGQGYALALPERPRIVSETEAA